CGGYNNQWGKQQPMTVTQAATLKRLAREAGETLRNLPGPTLLVAFNMTHSSLVTLHVCYGPKVLDLSKWLVVCMMKFGGGRTFNESSSSAICACRDRFGAVVTALSI